jgi:hypothetical protein
MTRRLLPLVLLLLLLPGLAQAVTRYVSAGQFGTPLGSDTANSCAASENINTPKRNLRGLNGALRCMGSGDTLYIRAGTYVDHILSVAGGDPNETWVMPSGGGSWATATTIAGYPGEARPIIRAPNDAHHGTVKLDANTTHQWLVFHHLDLDNDGTAEVKVQGNTDQGILDNLGVPMRGVSHVRFTDNIIRNAVHTCVNGGGSDVQFLNNEVYNCDVNVASGSGYAFYFPCIGCLWEGNDIHDISRYGIHEYETSIPSGLDNNIIRNNRFRNVNASGQTAFAIIMAHGNNNQAYNNLIYDGGMGIQVGWDCTNCKYYNNTIYNTLRAFQLLNDHSGSGWIRNNIVYNNTQAFEEGNQWNPSLVVRENNLCNTASTHCDHTGNPLFVDAAAGRFELNSGSAARNQGISVTVSTTPGAAATPLNTSFYGVARPQGSAYDIGAAEYAEGGGVATSGNPIYVAQTGGTPTTDCTTAENQATPIRTITQGLACMTVPGKTMFIKAGTYSEAIDTGATPITGGNGPSYSTATTIAGFGTDVVTIQLPVGGFLPLFLQNGANDKYILFRKLIFDAANRTDSNGIGFGAGVHHLRFEQVEVKNTVFEGIYVLGASNVELVQTSVHDAGAVAVQLQGAIDGFLCQHCALYDSAGGMNWNFSGDTGAKSNIVIRESILQNLSADALDAGTSTGAIVQNSIITDNTAGGVRVRAGASGMKVYNNTIANNGGVGLQCDTLASGVEFINDISWNNTGGNLVVNCGITPTTTTITDPLFAPGTYQLADGSSAINTGTTIPSLTVDYAGNARQQGPQDRGAYERDSVTPTGPGTDVTVRPPALFQAEMFF